MANTIWRGSKAQQSYFLNENGNIKDDDRNMVGDIVADDGWRLLGAADRRWLVPVAEPDKR